jgi:hypothetical protein
MNTKAKVYVRGFVFTEQDTIECMVRSRIDSHTIKRGTLKQTWLSSATR